MQPDGALRLRRRARKHMETPAVGGTRGHALDANFEVKAQAVAIFWKLHAKGMDKMDAYSLAGKQTGGNSSSSVQTWVRMEEHDGISESAAPVYI